MGISTRIYRQNRNDKYNKWDLETSKHERAIKKYADKEARKTDPKCIREDTAKSLAQDIYRDQKEVYEILYEKISVRAETLYNLILKDLGLDKDENAKISSKQIVEVINYYRDRGLTQIKNAFTEEDIKNYMPNKLSPYQKLFKNLIAKRAEFLIVAPKERLSLAMPYKKLKENDLKVSLVRHLAEMKLMTYKFAEKFPELGKMYDDMKNNTEL